MCVLHLSHEAESLLKPTVWLSVICSVGCWSTVTICFTLCCPVTFLIKLCCQFAFHSVKTIPRQDWLCKESPMSPLTPWFFLRWVLQSSFNNAHAFLVGTWGETSFLPLALLCFSGDFSLVLAAIAQIFLVIHPKKIFLKIHNVKLASDDTIIFHIQIPSLFSLAWDKLDVPCIRNERFP